MKMSLRTMAAVALLLAGCAKNKIPEVGASSGDEKPLSESGLTKQPIDLDADEVPEIFNYYRDLEGGGQLLVKKEIDLNRDGKVDVISYYDDQSRLQKEMMDGDYDGLFDWADYYEQGTRVRSEYDTDFDGKANVWKYYVSDDGGEPRVDRLERDIDGDGVVDLTRQFNAAGEVTDTRRTTQSDELQE